VLHIVNGKFFEVDVLIWSGCLDEVADFAFEADVGDEALASFCVEAGEIAGVRVTIRVGVLAVEEVEEVVSVFHGYSFWINCLVDV
jgi:hypothetical protein